MKAINYTKLKIVFFLLLLICSKLFSQSSIKSNTKEDIIKTEIKIAKEVQSSVNDNKINDQAGSKEKKNFFSYSSENKQVGQVKFTSSLVDSETGEEVLLVNESAEANKIEVNVDAGEQINKTLTIQNLGDSPLIWNVAPEGSEKLLYRLYNKDRDLFKLKNKSEQKSDAILTSEVYNAKETLMKVTDGKNNNMNPDNNSTDVNSFKPKQQIKKDNLINKLNDSHPSKFSDNIEQLKTLKTNNANKSTGISSLKDNNIDVMSNKITDKSKLQRDTKRSQKNVDEVNPENQLKEFKQWFRFSNQGRPEFDPKTEVWEVSCDSGVHWQQILIINGEKYVTNAKFFDPAFYLEYHVIKKRNSPYSNLTLLSEYVKRAENGPAIFPKDGIIPSNTLANIELEVDATSLEKGTYNLMLILTEVNSMEAVEVIPIRFTVISKSEKEIPDKLFKENSGEQLPDKYELFQNYPNPFNPSTTIKYNLPEVSVVIIKVYDVLGREVSSLVNELKQPGKYEINFDASSLSSGTYFYRIQAGSFIETKKMVLLK